MPTGRQHDDNFTEADRQAIAAIRRELDAEFGPLEAAEPLAVEPSPPPSRPATARPTSQPRPTFSPRPASPPRARPRVMTRAVPVFLLGALVGGAFGGVTGGLTTLLWLHYAPDAPARASAPSTERGIPADAGLHSALTDWLEATKAGDIERQMRFYPSRVPVYYTWRDVTRQAVRAEKVRVFGAATRLEITTDVPTVEVEEGGDSAVSRFRKRYVIEGPAVRRRGEVLQELRWARTPEGWRIVGERDAEVLAPSASVGPGAAGRGGTIDPAR